MLVKKLSLTKLKLNKFNSETENINNLKYLSL